MVLAGPVLPLTLQNVVRGTSTDFVGRVSYDDVEPKSRTQNPDAETPKFVVLHICLPRNVGKTVMQSVEA
jgi:hypothetical protein